MKDRIAWHEALLPSISEACRRLIVTIIENHFWNWTIKGYQGVSNHKKKSNEGRANGHLVIGHFISCASYNLRKIGRAKNQSDSRILLFLWSRSQLPLLATLCFSFIEKSRKLCLKLSCSWLPAFSSFLFLPRNAKTPIRIMQIEIEQLSRASCEKCGSPHSLLVFARLKITWLQLLRRASDFRERKNRLVAITV